MTSVTFFGAIGDSIHDDSAALQRALDADERHLYIPAGKYRPIPSREVFPISI